ncbi:MAG: FAD-dependent oxidoreductase [Eubacteriales bacterium]
MKTYVIPQAEVPVSFNCDVVVCGGGTAGVHAAVAAAKEGKSVILIEQFGSVGGSAGNALVTPLMHSHIEGDPNCSYITNLLHEEMISLGDLDESKRAFDPMILRIASEKLCVEAGVKILYYNFISDVITENGKVKGVVTVSKSGKRVVAGKAFIDCTGDGDVSVLAGAEYQKGNPETGKCQPISLRYIVSGVDIDALGKFILSEVARTGVSGSSSYNNGIVYAACTSTGNWTFTNLFDRAIAAGDLIPEDKAYWQMFMLRNRPGSLAFNNPEFFEDTDGTNADHLTRAQIEGKTAIIRQLKFYKKYMKGFESAHVTEIAPMVGVRETRHIKTEYVLTGEDLISRKKFPDAFCQSNYPVDIHGKVLNCKPNAAPVNDGKPWYEVPFRSLIVAGFDNLFVAGRCLGAEFLAQASLRIQPSVRSSGEAAGIGSAIMIDKGIKAKEVNGKEVREIMEKKGGVFKR